eukprot:TRINITY_DN21936_c0_g1_i3.p1 TRINITY_DN21936_c0_g1~~TRINITY_DN21936_c0_g1_i3.p1  ORF type:complete len:347 (+),score=10.38 TRINITY_DN21936_c0_g1_i3:46-1086(+)
MFIRNSQHEQTILRMFLTLNLLISQSTCRDVLYVQRTFSKSSQQASTRRAKMSLRQFPCLAYQTSQVDVNQQLPLCYQYRSNNLHSTVQRDNFGVKDVSVNMQPARESKMIQVPKHIAIIMDGNGRWARNRGQSVMQGHRAGADQLLRTTQDCLKYDNIQVLTVFALSLENLKRPTVEVQYLFSLFERVLENETQQLEEQGVRIRLFGDKSVLPKSLLKTMDCIQERSSKNQGLVLNVGVGYGARQDIVFAARKLAHQVQLGNLDPEDINEDIFRDNLSMGENEFSSPDLLIRTSGEQRLSNFLLWECAYSEIVFVQEYWPDFNYNSLQYCIKEFGQRQRRFGART